MMRVFYLYISVLLTLMVAGASYGQSPSALERSYRFLVNERETGGGVLYRATAGKLKGRQLPLSFFDSPAYWGDYVCTLPGNACVVMDSYDPQNYTLTPQKGVAGDLQTERVNTHSGANIYDAGTWQIAVMLGQVINRFALPQGGDAYDLVNNQNLLLQEGYSGNAEHAAEGANRARTAGRVFVYNGQSIVDARQAFIFRMLPRSWLSVDPFAGTPFAKLIQASGLPSPNPEYQPGRISWTDWKPISGENAWAFFIGPLQAAYLHYVVERKTGFVPFEDIAVQNALRILPAFAAMQSSLGAVYYAPAGTVTNQGEQLVNPFEVAVENSISLYAGLNILRATLQAQLEHGQELHETEKRAINEALRLIAAMIEGGTLPVSRSTAGLLAFFRDSAWRNGEFVQGGFVDDPARTLQWDAKIQPKAVDVNTWGIAALGARQIDEWFGFGAAYRNWQQVKQWGGYGAGSKLWGVGFSDQDGNGIDAAGNYRQGVISAEWTAGAILMVRTMIGHYRAIPAVSPQADQAKSFVRSLERDEQSMMAGLGNLRIDHYRTAKWVERPDGYGKMFVLPTLPYVYASKRYLIPFGWYANPIPSTCATAWIMMLENGFNPLVYGGKR